MKFIFPLLFISYFGFGQTHDLEVAKMKADINCYKVYAVNQGLYGAGCVKDTLPDLILSDLTFLVENMKSSLPNSRRLKIVYTGLNTGNPLMYKNNRRLFLDYNFIKWLYVLSSNDQSMPSFVSNPDLFTTLQIRTYADVLDLNSMISKEFKAVMPFLLRNLIDNSVNDSTYQTILDQYPVVKKYIGYLNMRTKKATGLYLNGDFAKMN